MRPTRLDGCATAGYKSEFCGNSACLCIILDCDCGSVHLYDNKRRPSRRPIFTITRERWEEWTHEIKMTGWFDEDKYLGSFAHWWNKEELEAFVKGVLSDKFTTFDPSLQEVA